ncbi:RagB/SusD family nutrient uptake outer membrane protein, partial [Pedobacter sp. UBA5917]|uniref:RagB/SusD family nutrient uptake outer membrane protein n=1 Tax=Pedobacter sp. UBA5917 TaxID=1947061 RepID=UPI0025E183E8
MKTTYYIHIVLFLISVGLLASCKKDFLDRIPETTITPNQFFKTTADLETYTNGFYGMFGPGTDDLFSDNISVNLGGSELDNMIRGKINPANVGGWSWTNLRTINYMLNNLQQVQGDAAAIRHFVGIARFYRGIFYYNMIRRYGDVPYYSKVLNPDDEAQLYKAKDPRALVADSVKADLEYAAANVMPTGTNTRITKWAALTVLARFCLFEGTFRKYHDELGLQATATSFLQRAESASKEVMGGGFSIYNTGKKGEDYQKLFTSQDLSGNKEMIFYDDYDRALNRSNSTHYVFDWQWALSKSLIDTYLMTDGTPFTSTANWDKKTYAEIFSNRDPRMAVTVMPPGFSTTLGGIPNKTRPTFGGYPQIKFYAIDPTSKVYTEFTDLPILRYAEVLLIQAEARAEMDLLNQTDLDNTINVLRNRAGVTPLNMAA